MSDFAIVGNWYIYPTFGVAGVGASAQSYKGSTHSELILAKLLTTLAGPALVFSGFVAPGSSADLTLAIPLGSALISGRVVTIPGSTTLTVTASQTNYIYLKLVKDADGYVLSASYEVNITGTAPADSVPIARATASGSAITSTLDLRPTALPNGSNNRMAVYATPGSFSFVPPYTGRAKALLIGDGGGGGSGNNANGGGNYASGGGGGGGAYVLGYFDMVAGVINTVVVGPGGTAAGNVGFGSLQQATAGSGSSVGGLVANGGGPGGSVSGSTHGAAGAGAAATANTSALFSMAGGPGILGLDSGGSVAKRGGNGGLAPGYKVPADVGMLTVFESYAAPTLPGQGGGAGCGQFPASVNINGDYTGGHAGGPGLVIIFW